MRLHWQVYALALRESLSFFVAGIGMAGDSYAGIIREHTLNTSRHQLGSISNCHLTRML
jgi:hypothetical protein